MKRQDFTDLAEATTGASSERRPRNTILAVGDVEEWRRSGQQLPVEGSLAFVSFEDITRELIELVSPSVVLSPLLARGFDCIDLAQLLHLIRFRGRYRALADALPNPAIIRNEINALCPDLDFDVVLLTARAPRAH